MLGGLGNDSLEGWSGNDALTGGPRRCGVFTSRLVCDTSDRIAAAVSVAAIAYSDPCDRFEEPGSCASSLSDGKEAKPPRMGPSGLDPTLSLESQLSHNQWPSCVPPCRFPG